MLNALAHVIVTEGLVDEAFVARALRPRRLRRLGGLRRRAAATARRRSSRSPACRPRRSAARPGSTPPAATARSTTASASPSTARARRRSWRIANLAMATGNLGRQGVGVNPLRGQNNVQGACDMGSFPHELSGYRHVSDDADARACSRSCGACTLDRRAGPAHPQHARRRRRRHLQGHLHPGRGHPAVRSQHPARRRPAWRRWNASSCRTCS